MTVVNNTSSGGEGEDARKKRGNSQDEREACKKVRSEKKAKEGSVGESDAGGTIAKASQLEGMHSHIKESGRLKVDTSPRNGHIEKSPPEKRVWDLESAILYLAQIGKASNKKSKGDTLKGSFKNTDKPDSSTTKTATICKKTYKSQPEEVKTSCIIREYLTNDENSWITFRAAHAGDASTIAQWYRKANDRDTKKVEPMRRKTAEETDEEEAELKRQPLRPSSSNEEENLRRNSNDGTIDGDDVEEENVSFALQLEHWLAEGLGDENTCPFVHGLIAYVHRSRKKENGENDKAKDAENTDATLKSLSPSTVTKGTNDPNTIEDTSHRMAAVVLMSLSWAHGKRHLKIEWMSIDSSNLGRDEGMALRQKVWLRIHTLSSMTNCQAISVDEELLMTESTDEKQEQGENEQHGEGEEEPLDGTVSRTAITRKSPFVEPSAE